MQGQGNKGGYFVNRANAIVTRSQVLIHLVSRPRIYILCRRKLAIFTDTVSYEHRVLPSYSDL